MGTKSSAVWWYGTRRARRTTQWQWVQFKHETNPSTQEIKIQQWVLEVSWSSQFTILSRKSCRVPKTPVETKDVAWLRFFLWCSGPSCCFGMESSPTARSHMGLTCHGAKWLKRKNVPIRRRVETFKRTYKISKYIYILYIYICISKYINIYQNIVKCTERVDFADAIKHQSHTKSSSPHPSTKGQHPRFTMNSVTSWTSTCFVSVSCPVHQSTSMFKRISSSPCAQNSSTTWDSRSF